MAKKVTTVIKLQLPAGGATPAPPVALPWQHGVNIMQFVKEYNERSSSLGGNIVPGLIDRVCRRSFTMELKTHRPPT
ncbi:MAG: hypothetical protein CM1200mP39_29050 [Dehalococcoidia bacterium]|nr:MAG: hypothetical protein CM1200mP39_29050 [Dehalococcoidia bacterium]